MVDINIDQFEIYEYNSVIIGSGAAGLNCALHLVLEGIPSDKIAIVTDNLGGGTSFNAGSDKQTYYKLSIYGDQADSPYELAKDLCAGGAMHGDIALIEATNSIREFFHLVQLGVPFPYDEYGGFVGYKTDNDPKQRATSIGPFTSQKMGDCLLNAVNEKNIPIFDKYYAMKILVDEAAKEPEAIGLICINYDELSNDKNIDTLLSSLRIFKTRNVIIATGGPAILYKNSVYPKSQKGTTSLAIEAGCKLQNLTESQFGLASTRFRWNVSGSYQQVIPRYFSLDNSNTEREFLKFVFPSFTELSRATFLKGYQWPFNSTLIEGFGSSLIDLAVYHETVVLHRKVFLDYTKNPESYDFDHLHPIAKEYLSNSDAIGDYPINRLRKLNEQAIKVYSKQGIDIASEPLEVAVCNQHLNGGISCDGWWESNTINHLFVIGEINGSHGVHRPGGAALNAGQVGGLRAALKIAHSNYANQSINDEKFRDTTKRELFDIKTKWTTLLENIPSVNEKILTINDLLNQIQNRMSKYATIIRPLKGLESEILTIQNQLNSITKVIKLEKNTEIIDYLRVKDSLLTHFFFLKAILDYHFSNGRSRGSYLILREKLLDSLSEMYILPPGYLKDYKFIHNNLDLSKKIQTLQWKDKQVLIKWENTRDIPSDFGWFENVWKDFLNRKAFKPN
ncbi:MAG: FAD-binding protein [Candidatus Lokiarchaeota archaeon]|nr:FAD-binding protein [Candidatus Lokiarchaeota archaeon]